MKNLRRTLSDNQPIILVVSIVIAMFGMATAIGLSLGHRGLA